MLIIDKNNKGIKMSIKSKINFIIDIFMFFIMAAIIGLGFLMKYILIPGKERWLKYDRNVDLSFLGLDRHEWGAIHLILGFILIGLLILHIIFHWKTIVCFFSRYISARLLRISIISIIISLCFIFLLFPFFIIVEVTELEKGYSRKSRKIVDDKITILNNDSADNKKFKASKANAFLKDIEHNHLKYDIDIKGYMTLAEICNKFKIPSEYLKQKLNLPPGTSGQIKVSWLRKKYQFRMSDIKKYIVEYNNDN